MNFIVMVDDTYMSRTLNQSFCVFINRALDTFVSVPLNTYNTSSLTCRAQLQPKVSRFPVHVNIPIIFDVRPSPLTMPCGFGV